MKFHFAVHHLLKLSVRFIKKIGIPDEWTTKLAAESSQ
jgi:hypothetical protein